MSTTIRERNLRAKLEKIVAKRFDYIPTLEPRHNDEDDFPEVSIWGLAEILRQAYEAGLTDAQAGITTISD